MLGLLLSLVICLGMAGLGRRLFSQLIGELDPALRWGMAGMFGLAVLGWATLPIGMIPGGLAAGPFLVLAVALGGIVLLVQAAKSEGLRVAKPVGWRLAIFAALALAFLFGIIAALGPIDTMEWDSLAYHLAVPKLWLKAGSITWIPTIHHSNFPFLVDNLYLWGLSDSLSFGGGGAAAKAYNIAYALFGVFALFGLARARYGEKAAWWAALALVATPVALWEMGTAYVDLAHGLWAGLGVLFAAQYASDRADKRSLWLAVWCLGFAAASKYTGLQVAVAVAVSLVILGTASKQAVEGLKAGALVGVGALVLCSPWLIRNVVNTGNPFYPFFHGVFHGKNWSAWHGEIYENEQHTFGVGNAVGARDWTQLPHAVLGMAYQPGRYTNPMPTEGLGMPNQALGPAVFCGALLWLLSGRMRRFEAFNLLSVGLCFLLWFVLSQQSRYSLNMGVPLCLLAGAAVSQIRAGPILAGLVGLQSAYAFFLIKVAILDAKLPVVLGKVSAEDYLASSVAFYRSAQEINRDSYVRLVALYDEVFGYYLDKPYFWANPGHSTQVPYDSMKSGADLADSFAKLGVTHVYVSFAQEPRGVMAGQFGPAAVQNGEKPPLSPEDLKAIEAEPQTKWKALILDAVRQDRLTIQFTAPVGVLFKVSDR